MHTPTIPTPHLSYTERTEKSIKMKIMNSIRPVVIEYAFKNALNRAKDLDMNRDPIDFLLGII